MIQPPSHTSLTSSTSELNLPPWLERQLATLLSQRGHAWLLEGPSGLGQYRLALALARAWLCDQPVRDAAGQIQAACGTCDSCHAVDVRTHADLAVLMPETVAMALNWPFSEKAQSEIDDKKRKPSKEIRVEALRDVVEFSQRTAGRAQGKVVLVFPAEHMNGIAANTLLKTLEEPAGHLRFILASENAQALLPTIRSRCQSHPMRWPDPPEALAWMREQAPSATPDKTLSKLLRATGGRPQDASDLLNAGPSIDPWIQAWSQLPQHLANGQPGLLTEATPPQAVAMLQKVCHDLMVQVAGGTPRYFDASDLPAAKSDRGIAANAESASQRWMALNAWARDLNQSAQTADHAFNPGLMLEALVSRAQTAIQASI